MQKTLSGLSMTEAQRAAVRKRIQGGRNVRRKKMPLALAIALVMVLLTATAYALTNWEQIKEYLGNVRKLSYETQGWPLQDRLELVELMHKAGLIEDEEAYQKLQEEGLSEEEKIAYSDRILEARYGKDWYWMGHDAIEAVEWPVEKRYESLESRIEYEKWDEQQRREWESGHPEEEEEFRLLTEEGARQLFREALTAQFGFTEESLDESMITAQHWTEERIWELQYTLTPENPGWHVPGVGDQLSRYTQEMTVMDYIKQHYAPDYLRDAYLEDADIHIVMTVDDWGRDARLRTLDMEHTMIEHMHDDLTEIFSFTSDSVEVDRIQVSYDEESRIWTATYTVDADHPGVFDNIPGEHEADTVYEAQCMWNGEQPSFTFTDQKTFLNRNPSENPQPPIQEDYIDDDEAVQTARQAILDQYACDEAALNEMTVSVQLTRNDGADEYYIEFTGYDHFSANYARLWNYAARVNAETGEIAAVVSREEWEPMTGQKLVVDDANREYVRADHLRRALCRAAGETEDDMEKDAHLYLKNGVIGFMDWSLEEKAEYSRTVKPRIDQFLAEHPEDLDFYLSESDHTIVGTYIATTRHAYGLPDDQSMSQDDAFDLACHTVHEAYGTDIRRLEQGRIHVYYDVTDPNHPLWKFDMDILNTATDMKYPYRYFVALDAYTGEETVLRVQSTQIPNTAYSMSDFM